MSFLHSPAPLTRAAGAEQNHQTHQDIDAGTFVLDAMGQRWAGELGSGNYLADGYFSSEAQNSEVRCSLRTMFLC